MLKPFYEHAGITIYHGDCREIAPALAYDCVLSDPPWGSDTSTDSKRFTKKGSEWWGCADRSQIRTHKRIHGDDKPFDPAPWADRPSILWGANNFASKLRDSGGWLIWDKREKLEEIAEKGWPLCEAELAWTNVMGTTRVFRNMWAGLMRSQEQGEFYHPTQKPISLMAWSIKFLPAGLILDPFAGSCSTLVAAKKNGRKAIGIEIEEKYCEIAAKRLSQEVMNFADGNTSTHGGAAAPVLSEESPKQE